MEDPTAIEERIMENFDQQHNGYLGNLVTVRGLPSVLCILTTWIAFFETVDTTLGDFYNALALSIGAAHLGEDLVLPDADFLRQLNGDQPVVAYRHNELNDLRPQFACADVALAILEALNPYMGEIYQLGLVCVSAETGVFNVSVYPVPGATRTIWIHDGGSDPSSGAQIMWSGFGLKTSIGLFDDDEIPLNQDDANDEEDALSEMDDEELERLGREVSGDQDNGESPSLDVSGAQDNGESSYSDARAQGETIRTRKLKNGTIIEYVYKDSFDADAPPHDTELPFDLFPTEGITLSELLVFFPGHCIYWPMLSALIGATYFPWLQLTKAMCYVRQSPAEYAKTPLFKHNSFGHKATNNLKELLGRKWSRSAADKLDFADFALMRWVPPSSVITLKEPLTLREIGKRWIGKTVPGSGAFAAKVRAAVVDVMANEKSDPFMRDMHNPPYLHDDWATPDETLPFVPNISKVNKELQPPPSKVTSLYNHRHLQLAPDQGVDQDELRDLILNDFNQAISMYYTRLVGENLLSFLTMHTGGEISKAVAVHLATLNSSRLPGEALETAPHRTTFTKRMDQALNARAARNGTTLAHETAQFEANELTPKTEKLRNPTNARTNRTGRSLGTRKSKQAQVLFTGPEEQNEDEEMADAGESSSTNQNAQLARDPNVPEGYAPAGAQVVSSHSSDADLILALTGANQDDEGDSDEEMEDA